LANTRVFLHREELLKEAQRQNADLWELPPVLAEAQVQEPDLWSRLYVHRVLTLA
jgi:hypothetical protein